MSKLRYATAGKKCSQPPGSPLVKHSAESPNHDYCPNYKLLQLPPNKQQYIEILASGTGRNANKFYIKVNQHRKKGQKGDCHLSEVHKIL